MSFACELPPERLAGLLADEATLHSLRNLGARVVLALTEHGDAHAAAVRRLNDAGVPVVAWLVLPREQGYFFNLDNAPAAAACYDRFRAWSGVRRLRWDAVAFDLEPSIEDLRRAFEPGERLDLLRDALRRARDGERLRRGTEAYAQLIERIHADGLTVESFQFPFVVDDRRARSTLVHRIMSAPDVRADREVLMLYTSFQGRPGPAVLASYGAGARAIAVGSTGGVVEADSDAVSDVLRRTLDWDELARDLRIAARYTDEIAIYSLEGCVSQGMLGRLERLDWTAPVAVSPVSATAVGVVRALLRGVLVVGAHPWLAGGLAGTALVLGARRAGRSVGARGDAPG